MTVESTGSVCAVVVTFNRKALLRKCLDSLSMQSRRPDQIVVVDNHSTDGTLEMLRSEYSQLTLVPLSENRGGAGGFAAGIDWAHRNGFEWIWVMDDDVEMLPGALEMLLSYRDVSDFIQSRKEMSGETAMLDCLWDISAGSANQPTAALSKNDRRSWISVQWGNFEGALIHRTVVDKIGLPDERFFIAGDDSTYGLEASFHTNVIYVKEYGVSKTLNGPPQRGKLSYYLLLRNRFIIRQHLHRYGFSSHPIVFWTSQLVALSWAIKSVLKDAGQSKKLEMIGAVLSGLINGARGRFGRPPFLEA